MMDQKNLLVAIVLSVAILFGFQYVFEKFLPHPAPSHAVPAQTTPAEPSAGAANPPPAAEAAASGTAPVGAASAALAETREAAIAAQPRIRIDTPRLHGSVALTGGRIDDLTLATYHETVDPTSPEVVLLWPTGTQDPYFAEFGWVGPAGGNVKVPDAETKWTASGGPLSPGHPLTLTWDNGAGLTFTRTISIDENYMFTVDDAVNNAGSAPVSLTPYGLISRTGTPPVSGYYILFEGPIGFLDGGLQEVKYASLLPDKPADFSSTGGWLGFTDKYWLTALIPPQSDAVKAQFRHAVDANKLDRYQADYTGAPLTVPANGAASTSTRFFAGAKEVGLLDAYANSGIPRFDRAIDFGWFYFLTKPIFLVLVFFHGLLGNFGLAILLLTFLIKLAFFPLANKSYVAMSKMKLMQPEVAKAREKYPDDKARQQQEIMTLYKKVGANPLAGCLPMVLQIPVFFSLYKVLFVTIEMRHAPFYGWIHDLSAPDPTSFANLFGLLPFAAPHMLMIGAWPLIMGVTMFLQQKLNPQPVDPMQARMFMFLPIVFTYMLSAFPAGLVIYWSWNNLLSIAQQWAIMHRRGAA
ncbi:MAG TPA: membrane protein insertase YidC [Stellaceae bacterium]|nr:membrane protein insertase YidC [Stellaceae bacterium]